MDNKKLKWNYSLEINFRLLFNKFNNHKIQILITGLPRSGTSFLAKLVGEMGYNLGPRYWLKARDKYNIYGYYECIPLKRISNHILSNFEIDYMNPSGLPHYWTKKANKEKKLIINIVKSGKIDLYKDNKLLLLSDLYSEIYPQAKWLYINRDPEETYKSRFGVSLSKNEWLNLCSERLKIWKSSKASTNALYLDYNDFKDSNRESVVKIATFLQIKLTEEKIQRCINIFRPNNI